MNKSESIKAGLRKRFQSGESKLAKRKCYGYKPSANGELVIDPEEAEIVNRIFTQYQSGISLGAIAAELFKQQIPSPTGKAQWSREAIHKLLSNEKYTGRVLLQKTVRAGSVQVKNEGEEWQYLYENAHTAIISDELFWNVRKIKASRAKIVS